MVSAVSNPTASLSSSGNGSSAASGVSDNSAQVRKSEQDRNQQEASARAAQEAQARANETRVTLSQQQLPQPNTADRNAKPADAYKAVSALRS